MVCAGRVVVLLLPAFCQKAVIDDTPKHEAVMESHCWGTTNTENYGLAPPNIPFFLIASYLTRGVLEREEH